MTTHGDEPRAAEAAAHLDRAQAFFAALQTEHFALESARGITVTESSSRAALYLTTVSGSLVAFGFLAHTPFAPAFLAAVLPAVVLLGAFTYGRLVETSLEDVAALAAIQRIRRFYGSLLPGAAAYFSVPRGGRPGNELLEIGRRRSWGRLLSTTSSAVGFVNSIVAGAGVAVVVDELWAGDAVSIVSGIAAAFGFAAAHLGYQVRAYRGIHRVVADTGPII
jgi:hypothetical protein